MRILCISILGVCWSSAAHAHVGHVGEVAGHSHWIGLGALVVAGAIAALVGKLASKGEPESEEDEELHEGGEAAKHG